MFLVLKGNLQNHWTNFDKRPHFRSVLTLRVTWAYWNWNPWSLANSRAVASWQNLALRRGLKMAGIYSWIFEEKMSGIRTLMFCVINWFCFECDRECLLMGRRLWSWQKTMKLLNGHGSAGAGFHLVYHNVILILRQQFLLHIVVHWPW